MNTHTCGGFLSGFLELLLLLAGYIYLHAQTHTPIARAPNATHILYHIYYSIANLQNSTQTYHTFFFCFKQSAEFLGSNITIYRPRYIPSWHIYLCCATQRGRELLLLLLRFFQNQIITPGIYNTVAKKIPLYTDGMVYLAFGKEMTHIRRDLYYQTLVQNPTITVLERTSVLLRFQKWDHHYNNYTIHSAGILLTVANNTIGVFLWQKDQINV